MNEQYMSHKVLACTHCGEKSRMRVVASVVDKIENVGNNGETHESGTLYEVQECPSCRKNVLVSGNWHELMDREEDLNLSVVLPEAGDLKARLLLAEYNLDLECMKLAVADARKCVSEAGRVSPSVGAVVMFNGTQCKSAYRSEFKQGDHAEYTLLEKKCASDVLSGSTVYTTLEPCTTRKEPKIACVNRLIARKVSRVVIGMLDPDDRIRGRGVLLLRQANIRVDLFPPHLMMELEELNREFIAEKERVASAKSDH
ncbi:MAG: hypothetical protein IPH49_05030 [Ignavibacteria bacterium]|nr:hypothetical protein [Ignavibacteria bacterium]